MKDNLRKMLTKIIIVNILPVSVWGSGVRGSRETLCTIFCTISVKSKISSYLDIFKNGHLLKGQKKLSTGAALHIVERHFSVTL